MGNIPTISELGSMATNAGWDGDEVEYILSAITSNTTATTRCPKAGVITAVTMDNINIFTLNGSYSSNKLPKLSTINVIPKEEETLPPMNSFYPSLYLNNIGTANYVLSAGTITVTTQGSSSLKTYKIPDTNIGVNGNVDCDFKDTVFQQNGTEYFMVKYDGYLYSTSYNGGKVRTSWKLDIMTNDASATLSQTSGGTTSFTSSDTSKIRYDSSYQMICFNKLNASSLSELILYMQVYSTTGGSSGGGTVAPTPEPTVPSTPEP